MGVPIHDAPNNIGHIFDEVRSNLYDVNLRWFSSTDVLNSIQDAYNKLVGLLCPIEHSTLIPQEPEPYYGLDSQIPNFMYISGIFNPHINQWLEGLTYKQMKATYQTYLAIGQPKWFSIMDLKKVLVWPYDPGARGVLYILFKESAPQLIDITARNCCTIEEQLDSAFKHVPILPYSTGPKLLEYFATADLLEQAREFKKAKVWWDKALLVNPTTGAASLYLQCKKEIESLARMDRETVLEPYRWIFHGGQFNSVQWINNEIPSGVIDGANAVFSLSQVPNPTSSLILSKDGQILYQGLGYSLNGQTITLVAPYIPNPTDALRAWYTVA